MKNKTRKQEPRSLSLDEQARWLCLLQAVNVAADFAEAKGINTDKSYKWIKPCAFLAYMDEMMPSMKLTLEYIKDGAIME